MWHAEPSSVMIVGVSEMIVFEGDLPVGDPARPGFGRAVFGSLLVSIAFVVFTWIAKEVPAFGNHVPWQDDPYDAIVSFAIFFVPLLVALCALRVPLCRRNAPLPVRRVVDLLRGSRTLLALVGVTLTSDWASVLLGAQRRTWTAVTGLLISLLALLTAFTLISVVAVWRATRGVEWWAPTSLQPDWAADAITLGEHAAARLGPQRARALRTLHGLDRRLVAPARRRPLSAAAALSVAFSAAVTGSRAIEEGVGISLFLFFAVAATGMFAFLAAVGTHLQLLGARRAAPGVAVQAAVLGCATVPLTLAFRDSLWWIIGQSQRTAGVAEFFVLATVVAAVTVLLFLARETLRRRCRRSGARG